MNPPLVFLAEDNQADVFLVRQALANHGVPHTLEVASDGEEALDYFAEMGSGRQHPCPDLLLLDLNLPKVPGLDLMAAFRQHPQCNTVPIIVMSSSAAAAERERMEQYGITAFFQKPSQLDAFLRIGEIIQSALDRRVMD